MHARVILASKVLKRKLVFNFDTALERVVINRGLLLLEMRKELTCPQPETNLSLVTFPFEIDTNLSQCLK